MARRLIVPAVVLVAAAAGACGGCESMTDAIATGDYWYRMEDPEGKPQGYAHLVVGAAEGDGRRFDWELKIAYSGGAYEEWRSMTIDAEGRLIAASYATGEDFSTDLRRKGEEWAVSTARGQEASSEIREIPADAATGMVFVLAVALPQEEGAGLERTELDETKGFTVLGPTVFAWKAEEEVELEGGRLIAHRFQMKRADDTALPIWIGEDRTILQVDWGGGNLMKLSEANTKHLFQPAPPAVTQVSSGPEELVVRGRFAGASPEEIFDHLTRPELLTKWWPPEAEVDLTKGGKYHLSWPKQEWLMRGEIRSFERGRHFTFTWTWDHQEDEAPVREVHVVLEPHPEGGTGLTLTQGPYEDTEKEQEARRSHLKGWEHFLTRLRDVTDS
ncbi:MAG: SRPBCC family protein [Planctomycetota bacterium]|jgi:uncharacterized protein YndB with AHSA1/START domain